MEEVNKILLGEDSAAKTGDAKPDGSSKSERGATMVEYALLVAMMSIGLITSVTLMRQGVEDVFFEAAERLGEGGVWPS